MLKMMTFFQSLPSQQPMPETFHFPGSPPKLRSVSEAESETSMSEASSEDLMPPLLAGVAPGGEEEETAKKEKKKPKGLANMFSVFTKGKKKKKKGQPSSTEPESEPKTKPELDGPMPTVEELKEALELGRLEAARPLLALERELVAAAAAGGMSAEELVQRQSKVEALYVLLRGQVLGVLRRPLEVAPERLRQALAVVAEQELEDRRATAAGPRAAELAATRPRCWLQLWRGGVAEVAAERLAAPPTTGAEGLSEAERVFLHMGRTIKEDLVAAVERLKPLFPAEFDVVATYAKSYHEHFATHLSAMAQFELCERDTYLLLLWVQNFYPNEILSSPKLAGELQGIKLGSLLPPKQIRLLEATFLSGLGRHSDGTALSKPRKPGRNGEGGCYCLSVCAGLKEAPSGFSSYQHTFDEFLERGKQLKNYRANVIANVNNCLSFRTSMEQKWQIPQNPSSHLLDPLNELKGHSFDILLQNLFVDLKPLFKKFTQTRWAAPAEILEEIFTTVFGRLPEFSELQDCFQKELMEAVHLHLVKEYIIRLSKPRLVLKTAEQQQQLAKHILANAEAIRDFCTKNGSPATWLHLALPTLAEIIRLQDPSAIKMEVATYAISYPDFSKGHLSAILAIKGNLSSSDVKSIRNILDIDMGVQEPSRSLFSLISIG
uniref:Tumor necrosis factor alpha-induced protein 2 n=2 Tax=Castor canadensis TaxID=51338 RepID=A0A8B7UX90_CASCN|nr:tumor necrosis factor alpha-induced protein 2 [Castor canadensis]